MKAEDWRDIKKETPALGQRVLLLDSLGQAVTSASFGFCKFHARWTHWMPLVCPEKGVDTDPGFEIAWAAMRKSEFGFAELKQLDGSVVQITKDTARHIWQFYRNLDDAIRRKL